MYDIGMDKNEPWFSMELIEGQSLQEKIEYHRFTKEEWPLFQRLDLFYKVCDAVAYAHSKNILHLDIKPDNIRLGLYGEVILCDWGLGYYIYDDEDDIDYLETPHLKNENTLHGYIRGTPGFLAPERIKGGKSVSSDVFSVGALLFILLTYEIPFIAENLDGILKRTLRGNITEPKVKIPVSIKSIYSKALKVN
ncbi:MAG: protein kinase [Lentisphaerales bacterium]|nr:protein kinase [Lentisphaerales bacterium]